MAARTIRSQLWKEPTTLEALLKNAIRPRYYRSYISGSYQIATCTLRPLSIQTSQKHAFPWAMDLFDDYSPDMLLVLIGNFHRESGAIPEIILMSRENILRSNKLRALMSLPVVQVTREIILEYRKDPWVTRQALKFALEVMHGADPADWFKEENITHLLPDMNPLVRESQQRMLLPIQLLAAFKFLELPSELEHPILYAVQREIDIWNVEMVLAYLLHDFHHVVECQPQESEGISSFELIPNDLDRLNSKATRPFAFKLLTEIVVHYIVNNMPSVDLMSTPDMACTLLGASELQGDGPYMPSTPKDVQEFFPPLMTIRLASALKPSMQLSMREPSLYWNRHILPMILTSLPFCLLKFILFLVPLPSSGKYGLAKQIHEWRFNRKVVKLEEIARRTSLYITYWRNGWSFNPEIQPRLAYWTLRDRWVELPILVNVQRPDDGTWIEIFDYKRCFYRWQLLTTEQARTKENLELTRHLVGN
jgi:hypothetical protein